MYNTRWINISLKTLGCITVIGAILYFVSGFFVAQQEFVASVDGGGGVAWASGQAVGDWITYELQVLIVTALSYVILGVLYKINNTKSGK